MAKTRHKTKPGAAAPAAPKDPEIAALDAAARALTRRLGDAPPRESGRLAAALGDITARLAQAHEARRARETREEDFDRFCRWEEAELRERTAARLQRHLDAALAAHPGDASAALGRLRRAIIQEVEAQDGEAAPEPEPDAGLVAAGRRCGMDG